MTVIEANGRTVEISRPDKLLFPDDGITKLDLAEYYLRIAETMLPFVRNRPVSMHRFPDGITGEDFFHKDTPDYFPDWIERCRVEKKEGGTVAHAVCNDAATLVYLAGQACITPHVWLSAVAALDRPDRMIFDLDPARDDFDAVRKSALLLKDSFRELDLPAFVMTTGSRGLHVVTPLDRSDDFDAVRNFAREVADALTKRHPDLMTVEHRKEKRGDRIFLDTLRNGYAQTSVPPYAVRARPTAPIAAPLDWDEVQDRNLDPRQYTIRNIFRRLGQKRDPWSHMNEAAISLNRARERLSRFRK